MNMKRPKATPVSPQPMGPNDSMRRLQIGIAGVMAVLLLVGLAGLIGDRAREQVASDAGVAAAPAATGGADKGSGAPLEELGVQPVTPADPSAAGAAPAAKAPPLQPATAKVPDLEPDPALQRARNKSAQ
jgi:predicted lipid-binding transport protein (Tim44 family)